METNGKVIMETNGKVIMDTKRSSNFSSKEIEHLIKLVEKKKNIIECKKTDRTSSEEKMSAWKELETEFNSAFHSCRSYKTLKMKYENLKKTAKKNYSLDKMESYKTGGGPKPLSNVSEFDISILEIVQEEQITGHESIYDDDKLETQNEEFLENDITSSIEFTPVEANLFEPMEESPKEKPKWDKYTPKMLKMPKHSALNTVVKRKTTDVWADVAKLKLKKIQKEIEMLEAEAPLRKTKLELEITLLKQQIEKNSTNIGKSYPKEF